MNLSGGQKNIQFDTITCADFLDIAPTLPDSCLDLSVNDLPYFKCKKEWWDRQWDTVDGYLEWLDRVCQQWYRLLKPNGSLYVFASPKMAARVEVKLGEWFNVLNRIIWRKGEFDTRAEMFPKDTLRSFFPIHEIIFFCEHYGADNAAKGESGYRAKCGELRGFVFEPLRAYLDGERRRAEIDKIAINVACGFSPTLGGMASRHYFSQSQWQLPTFEHYQAMQALFNRQGRRPAPSYEDYHTAPRSRFERDHSEREYLRAEYEYLRAEYENLRRPFNVTAQDQYTDVWDFPTVKAYPGKHPCEKPLEMLLHIVNVSSKPGDLVADFFCGSGVTAEAAMRLGRRYFCCDVMQHWADFAKQRIERVSLEMAQMEMGL